MKYLKYKELTSALQNIAEANPGLVRIESIGRSHEGRDIWVAIVTDFSTGRHQDKPAMLIDGNIHAVEIAASAVALNHINEMVERFGCDEEVTRCLKQRVFYVVPRVNPDGAEAALAEKPRFLRSGTRPYFHASGEVGRLVAEDVDGDGRLLSMRIADPNGRWKEHPSDARVMAPRGPTETGGRYYRLLPEGRVEHHVEDTIPPVKPREGMDFNRNWPANWVGEGVQAGAGRFPLSEPETHALASFISEHTNIFCWVAGHTFSGVLLRPGFSVPDERMSPPDLHHYKLVGAKGTELSGYPAVSAFSGFRINHGEEIHGTVEWGYENFGIYTWIAEYWAPHQAAGVEIENFAGWFLDHPGDDDLRMVRWGDDMLGKNGFVDWYAFDHPALGKVELGGWDLIRTLYNPPVHLLPDVVRPFPEWFLYQLQMSPLLAFRGVKVTSLGDGHWLVRAVIENTGYLPTFCSAKALQTKAVRGVRASLCADAEVTVIGGAAEKNLGELGGRAFRASSAVLGFLGDHTDDRAVVEWVVSGPAGEKLLIEVHHDRAGRVSHEVQLG